MVLEINNFAGCDHIWFIKEHVLSRVTSVKTGRDEGSL